MVLDVRPNTKCKGVLWNPIRGQKPKFWSLSPYWCLVEGSTAMLDMVMTQNQVELGKWGCSNAVLMAQMSWNFVCDLTWVVSERFHDQKGTIMCQAPGWVQDPKIQKFQEFWNSDIFFNFFVQNWLPRTQRPFPLNSWWKNGPFWCKNHCSSSKTVDFSIFSGGARKKVGPLGGPLSDMTPNTLVYHFSYIFRKSQWVWGVLAPK